jgi:nucleotide-binding universal stress UspA family protein
MPEPIIAAVDPHRPDAAPAQLGALFARLTGAPLLIAATYPVDLAVDALYPEYVRSLRLDTERALRRIVGRTEGETVAVRAGGSPAHALHELAEREHASLLVIGSSPRGQAGRVLPGAVTDRLLHGAPCPVAVAPAGYRAATPEVIGVAFTDTPDGHAALDAARTLAAQADARVRVFVVTEPLDWVTTGMLDGVALADADRARHERAEHLLELALEELEPDRSAGGEVLAGRPAPALAEASSGVDLLVCGSRGYGPVQRALLGSVSEELIARSRQPVLVIPRPTPAASAAAA